MRAKYKKQMDAGRTDLKSQPLNSLKEARKHTRLQKERAKLPLHHPAGRGGGEEISAEDQESKRREECTPALGLTLGSAEADFPRSSVGGGDSGELLWGNHFLHVSVPRMARNLPLFPGMTGSGESI